MDSEGSAQAFVRKSRSGVWEHFTRRKDAARCNLCGKEYKFFNSTSNLSKHLRTSHSDVWKDAGPDKASTKPITSWVISKGNTHSCSSSKAKAITELIVDWLSTSGRPLSIVNDPGFKGILGFLEPDYQVPSRTHVASLIKKRHQNGKQELGGLLRAAPAVALTTDAWTSRATQSYATYTAHFISETWKLESYVLRTSLFPGSHTAANIADHAVATCATFDLDETKIVAAVHDEAANMVAAGRLRKEEFGWANEGCGAHRLQTAVKHAISSVREVEVLLAHSRRLVAHFHRSSLATEALVKQQTAGTKTPLKLIQDCATRWNSSYYMLERLLALKLPVITVLDQDAKKDVRQLTLKTSHWELAKEVTMILAPLENATDILGAEKYVTLSILQPIISKVIKKCSTPVSSDGESATAQAFRKSLAKELRGKFPCQPTSTATIATALDPRFRQLGFLSEENKSRTKAELRRLALGVATAPRDGDGDEPEIAEPPAKKKCNESKLAKLLEDEEPDCNSTTSCLSSDIEAEVLLYTSSRPVPLNADPLEWWSGHYSDYPHLAVLARRFLCIPATSVPAERVFSAAGIIVNKLRCSLQHNNVDALIFLQKNRLQSTRSGIAELPALPVTATEEINKEDVLQEELELDSPDLPCLD